MLVSAAAEGTTSVDLAFFVCDCGRDGVLRPHTGVKDNGVIENVLLARLALKDLEALYKSNEQVVDTMIRHEEVLKKTGNIFRVGIFLDFVRRTTHADVSTEGPHGVNQQKILLTRSFLFHYGAIRQARRSGRRQVWGWGTCWVTWSW